jgi:mercuric ion binding protein
MAISWPRRALLAGLLASAAALGAEPKTAILDVPSMFCSLCQISVRKALERVPGVIEAKADNNLKRAEVKYDPEKVSAHDLATALTNSGYPATVRAQ